MKAIHCDRESFDEEVNRKLNVQPTYNVCSVSYLSEFQTKKGYECMIRIGNEEFLGNACENRKPCETETSAENNAARYTYRQMSKCGWKLNEESEQKKQVIINNSHNIPGVKKTEKGCLILENMGTSQLEAIHECGKYMSKEVLARHFKDIVRIVSSIIADDKFDPGELYSYNTTLRKNDYYQGYSCKLDFREKHYYSLGVMIDENQAEQSAAEVALRTLGYIPQIDKKDYLIQPYGGGLSRRLPPGIKILKPYLFTSTLLYDLLEAFMDAHNMCKPKYFIRNASQNVQDEFTVYGDTVKYIECICSLFGKIFSAPIPYPKNIALQLAANEALNYFHVDRIQQRFELRKCFHINGFEFSRGARTIYCSRPSVSKGWIWPKFCGPDEYKDARCGVQFLHSSIIMHNWPHRKYMDRILRQELSAECSFRGTNLIDMEDLSVTSVDSINPDLFIVGNAEFSVKILFKEGKVYSTHRECHVTVKPGHNIKKLKCESRISLPSLEVHLNAIDCHELYFLNPPKPVVTSCGAVALFHDFNASPSDIYVLLVQRTSGTSFESKACRLMLLLHSLITPNSTITVTPEECVEGIEKWFHKEVKLLSEMTMESLDELMSTSIRFDIRWNELVGTGELPAPLKKIKELCQNELKRRDVEEIHEDENMAETWELPHSEFVSKFGTIGIFFEDSTFCAFRVCAEVGAKLRLADLETCKTVDIPDETDGNHGGGVSRYYIWNGIWLEKNEVFTRRKADCPEDLELMKEYQLVTNAKTEHGMNRYQYPFNQKLYMYGTTMEQMYLMQNIEFVNLDGSRTKYTDELQYKISEEEMEGSIHYEQLEEKEKACDGEEEKRIEEEIEKGKESDVKEEADILAKMEMGTEEEEVEDNKKVEANGLGEPSVKKRICQRADNDDIPAARIDRGVRIDRGFDILNLGKHAKNDNQVQATGNKEVTPVTLATPETPGMKCDSDLTSEEPKTIIKGEVPPLPARDAYRQQCMWMKVDDAVNVCPMLMKISQTSEFKEQLTKLVEEANRTMRSRGLNGSVDTTLLSK